MAGRSLQVVDRRKYRVRICFLLLLVFAITTQLFSDDFQWPLGTNVNGKIKSREKTIHQVTVLPPSVVMAERGWRRIEELDSEESKSESFQIVSEALKRRGWNVNESALSPQVVLKDEKIRNLVDYLLSSYATLIPQVFHRPQDISKGRYSLGGDVAALAPFAPADALVFTRSYFFGRWDKKTFNIIIALVDPQSGELLSLSNIRHMTPFGKYDTEKKIQFIFKELRKIP